MRSTINVINYRFFSRAPHHLRNHLIKKFMCHVSPALVSSLRSMSQAVLLHNIKVINFKTNGVGREVYERKFNVENDIMLWI